MESRTQSSTRYWWREKDQVHNYVTQAVRWLDNYQRHHSIRNLHNLRLYSNQAALGLNSGTYWDSSPLRNERLMVNVVASVTDAAVAQIATQKPRVMNLTEGGNYSQQQRAKRLNQWVEGIFYETEAYLLGRDIFRDACIFGTGIFKIYEERGKACVQRIFPDDILIDDRDARNGRPRQLFQTAEISRDLLSELYRDAREGIDKAGNTFREHGLMGNTTMTDLVGVCEAWHLPSGPDADDGRHVICVDNATLLDEPWTKESFPFNFFRWGHRPLGFWGWGLGDSLTGIQIEINYLLQKIQRLMTLATSQIWVRKGAGIDKNKFTNEDMAIREYVSEPPIFMPVQSVSPEYFQHLDRLYNRAYEITGVNQLTAQAQKPKGLNSGVALDSFQDNQSQRFLDVVQGYEEFFVRLGDMLAELVDEISERDGSYSVKTRANGGLELLDWKDVKIDRDSYVSQPYPTSFFPQTPSGKWKQIQEMMSSGFLSPEQAAELMDYPDLEAVTRLRNAPIEFVKRTVEDILDKGLEPTVEPYTPLELVAQMVPLEVLRAEQQNAPEERIEVLRAYLNECLQRIGENMPAPQQPTQPPMPQGIPPATVGGGPPTGMMGAALGPTMPMAPGGAIQ